MKITTTELRLPTQAMETCKEKEWSGWDLNRTVLFHSCSFR
jgi:hypothetical protein